VTPVDNAVVCSFKFYLTCTQLDRIQNSQHTLCHGETSEFVQGKATALC
jgi:hypothetical protein